MLRTHTKPSQNLLGFMADKYIPKPDLTIYDVNLVNSSAGKDSQAMLDYVVEVADQAGVRDRIIVVHADLGRVEWPGTRKLAEQHARHYGVRFEVVQRHGKVTRDGRVLGDLLDRVEERGMWPAPMTRWCTSDFKRSQVLTLMVKLGREFGRHIKILNCLGLRADESPARAKRKPFTEDPRATNSKRTVHTWLPIHHWNEARVWQRIRDSGVPYHRAYDLGMPRLSCRFCIFAPRSALMLAGKHNPELLDEYVRVEEKIDHRFRVDCSMREIKDALERGEQPGAMDGAWNM